MTNTYTTETDPLGHFVVVNNGEVDLSYVEASESALRKQMLHDMAHDAITAVGRSTWLTLRAVGTATLELFDACAEASKQADTAK